MKKGIYRSLAISGIRKNKKLYLPYILTCTGMVMMCYIVSFIAASPVFTTIPGGDMVKQLLSMGFGILSVFSLLFLFYTNSFLIRRRKKEFGLYNILGMGKKNLSLVLLLETLFIGAFSIACGLFLGILFSKFSELAMVKILGGETEFTLSIGFSAISQTVILFCVIFLLLFLNSLRQLHLSNPVELLRSENTGEKPPKANWLVALLGVVILAGAYYLAVTISDPVSAILWFFVAAIMVIIATYLLFMAGSVALCRILQKNKGYYYKTNHFVSVSSMAYRMKRNGAGLASICILCTMVLIMVSSTACLYMGTEDSIRSRYPRHINLYGNAATQQALWGEAPQATQAQAEALVEEQGYTLQNVQTYRTAAFGGVIEGNQIRFDNSIYSNRWDTVAKICQFFVVPLADYNRVVGAQETLEEDEVLIYSTKELSYGEDTIRLGDGPEYTVKKQVSQFVKNGIDSMQIFPTVYLFVNDPEALIQPVENVIMEDSGSSPLIYQWYYGFDLSCDQEAQEALYEVLMNRLENTPDFFVYGECAAAERGYLYGMYGGLFFLGILLGIVFVFAAVLIIYYKQISEGYEDQSRFAIMQKVGMSKKDIRRSINSQILTVFFLPLIAAGVHLAFAFPMIRKLLLLFSLTNFPLLVGVTAACYLVFALFYLLVYRATSRSYFAIVSGMNHHGA